MQLHECFVAADVRTPQKKILHDIKKYLFPSLAEDEIRQLKKSSYWEKIVRLAERLEFVDRLARVREEILAKTRCRVVKKDHLQECLFECQWLDEDFSGAHKDIESLELFLLVSAIDEMVEDYKQLDKYLIENWNPKNKDETKKYLESLIQEHNDRYGMMKGIRKAFSELDPVVEDIWLSTYCALKLRKNKFDEQDFNVWHTKEKNDKLKLLANALANCRNQYVHKAFRQFECDTPVWSRVYVVSKKEYWLLKMKKDGMGLIELLVKTVQSIAAAHFFKGC